MLRGTRTAMGFEKWPWPAQLPLATGTWFKKLSNRQSISGEVRGMQMIGDCAVVGVLVYATARVYGHFQSGAYQTRRQHLTCYPPAIIANEFDFADETNNRTVEREDLQRYRQEFQMAKAKGEKVESFIFKY